MVFVALHPVGNNRIMYATMRTGCLGQQYGIKLDMSRRWTAVEESTGVNRCCLSSGPWKIYLLLLEVQLTAKILAFVLLLMEIHGHVCLILQDPGITILHKSHAQ